LTIGALAISTIRAPASTLIAAAPIATQYGVSASTTADSILIDQSGLGQNGATIVLTKGYRADTIAISQYGRILK
jgi:hypothetical protein